MCFYKQIYLFALCRSRISHIFYMNYFQFSFHLIYSECNGGKRSLLAYIIFIITMLVYWGSFFYSVEMHTGHLVISQNSGLHYNLIMRIYVYMFIYLKPVFILHKGCLISERICGACPWNCDCIWRTISL